MNPFINRFIFVLSLFGLFIAGYLWYMHAFPADIPCGGSHGCATVAESKYSQFPPGIGPPVAAYGTIGYLAIVVLSFLRTVPTLVGRDKIWLGLITAGASVGTVASLSLTYAEAFLIHAWCRWCVASQIIMLILLGLSLAEWVIRSKVKTETL